MFLGAVVALVSVFVELKTQLVMAVVACILMAIALFIGHKDHHHDAVCKGCGYEFNRKKAGMSSRDLKDSCPRCNSTDIAPFLGAS